MTEDEKRAVIVSQAEISPEKVTNQVLQICNVVRQPLAVHGDHFAYVRRRSGLGGTGGRNLSPELRIKFGTYGFSKKGSKVRNMKGISEAVKSPHQHGRNYASGAYTNFTDFDGSQADYRANMAVR